MANPRPPLKPYLNPYPHPHPHPHQQRNPTYRAHPLAELPTDEGLRLRVLIVLHGVLCVLASKAVTSVREVKLRIR